MGPAPQAPRRSHDAAQVTGKCLDMPVGSVAGQQARLVRQGDCRGAQKMPQARRGLDRAVRRQAVAQYGDSLASRVQNLVGGPLRRCTIGGYLGVITALAAWYASAAGVSNGTAGNRIKLPVGPPLLAPSPVPATVSV